MSIHFAIPHLFQFQVAPIPAASMAAQAQLNPSPVALVPSTAGDANGDVHDGLEGQEQGEAEAIRVLYRFDVG